MVYMNHANAVRMLSYSRELGKELTTTTTTLTLMALKIVAVVVVVFVVNSYG